MRGTIPHPDQRDKDRERRLQEARARPGEGRGNTTTKTTTRHSQQTADGSAVSTVTKTERLVQSSKGPSRAQDGIASPARPRHPAAHTLPLTPAHADDGTRTARTTTVESSFVRRSESKATGRLRVPACQPTSSGSSSNCLSELSSVCLSVQPSLSLLCLWLPASLRQPPARLPERDLTVLPFPSLADGGGSTVMQTKTFSSSSSKKMGR